MATQDETLAAKVERYRAGGIPEGERVVFLDEVLELAQHADRMERILDAEPEIGPLRQDGENGAAWSLGHHPMHAVILGNFAEMLERTGAANYLKRAVGLLAAHGISWDGPTTFLPDGPIDDGIAEPGRDWLWIDFTRTPNVLRCKRCGGAQALPERATISVFQAIHKAFSEQHGACQEGDAARSGRRSA